MNKSFTIITSLLLFSLNSFSQSPAWSWATSNYGSNNDYGHHVAADAMGNIYLAGSFTSATLHCGTITLTNDSSGSSDMYIAKYNSGGTIHWAKNAGGTKNEVTTSVAVDAAGNVYATGYFESNTVNFSAYTLINDTTNFSQDIFLVKYDANGNVIWARSAGGSKDDYPYSVAADAFGNVYLTGSFLSPTIAFGLTTLTNISGNYTDMFLTKYDSAGNVIWARSNGGSGGNDWGSSVNSDGEGKVYLAGNFGSTSITFGLTTLSNLSNTGTTDIFIAKYDSSGTVIWAESAGGTVMDVLNSSSIDVSGNTYVTGYFQSPTLTFGNNVLNNSGTANIFIAKYDSAGDNIWAKKAGGTSDDEGNAIYADNFGNLYNAGFFTSTTCHFDADSLTCSGAYDQLFLNKYDTSGIVLWVKTSVGTNNGIANSIACNALGDVYITGEFKGNGINFGMITLLNISPSTYDAFLAKIDGVTGTEEFSQNDNNISVYPNPSTSEITIHLLSYSSNQQLLITDILGNEVYSQPIINQESSIINILNWSSGVYFYQIRNSKETFRGKFVKVN